jgi:hypothetical protein
MLSGDLVGFTGRDQFLRCISAGGIEQTVGRA